MPAPFEEGEIERRRVQIGLGRTHAVADRPVAADAETLVDAMTPLQAGICGRVRIGKLPPGLRHHGVKPLHVLVGPGLVCLNRLLSSTVVVFRPESRHP